MSGFAEVEMENPMNEPRFCTNCGKALALVDEVCPLCGTQIRREPLPSMETGRDGLAGGEGDANVSNLFCAKCGSPMEAGDRYCPQCRNESSNRHDGYNLFLRLISFIFTVAFLAGGAFLGYKFGGNVEKDMRKTTDKLAAETSVLLNKRLQDISTPALNELFGMELGETFSGMTVSSDSTNVLVGAFTPQRDSLGFNSSDFFFFAVFLSLDKQIKAVRAIATFQGDAAEKQIDEKCEELIDLICKKLEKANKSSFVHSKELKEEVWSLRCKKSPFPQDITQDLHYSTLVITKKRINDNSYLLLLELGYESFYQALLKEQMAK